MNELKLSRAKVKVIWEGNEYQLSKPSLGVALTFEQKLAEVGADAQKSAETIIEFLSSQGLPREVLMEMDVDSVTAVMGAIMPTKKK